MNSEGNGAVPTPGVPDSSRQSPPTRPLVGVVVVKQNDQFGFIKVLPGPRDSVEASGASSRVYFSSQDCASPVNVGQRVSFEVTKDPSSGKVMAIKVTKLDGGAGEGDGIGGVGGVGRVDGVSGSASATNQNAKKLLSPEPVDLEIAIEGRFTGVVQALPKAGVSTRVDDGMLSFIDLEGRQQQAMFGKWRVEGVGVANGVANNAGAELELGQPVMFTLAQNPVTKELKANAVRVDHDVFEAMKRLGIGSVGTGAVNRGADTSVTPSNASVNNKATQTWQRTQAKQTSPTKPPAEPEFGKVVLLKKEFGFIKRMFETSDLFFHFSELDVSADPTIARGLVNVGDELEFAVHTDDAGRVCARNIKRAPPGSAQFEVIGEEIFHGVVLEKPALGKSYEKTPGVIDFVAAPLVNGEVYSAKQWASAPKTKMLFYPNESEGIQSLRPGSHVAFRILTDINALKSAKMAGKDGMLVDLIARRAVQMHPIRGEGVIVDIQKAFGFLTWSGNFLEGVHAGAGTGASAARSKQHRLFFSRHDMDRSQEFKVGDVVYFLLQSTKSSDDMAASRLRKSETPPINLGHLGFLDDPSLGFSTAMGTAMGTAMEMGMGTNVHAYQNLGAGMAGRSTEPPTRRKPLKLKKPSVAQPRIPDGTRGFTLPRGSWLREGNVDEENVAAMCCGFRLRGVLLGEMTRSLSVEAIPFEMRL